LNGPRYNGRSRGTRMFQNSERGNTGPGGGSNAVFTESRIGTWFNPSTESKKGTKIKSNYLAINIDEINNK